jgi:aspartyl-tRNA(Asn)/glutamyl-tRNA(Gln) amidotransferase subunit C
VQIDPALLTRLETLSRLRIDADKKEEVMAQLSEIVAYVENLNACDTEHLDAAFSTLEGGTPLRADRPQTDPAVSEAILDRAPESADHFFIVPAIID